MYKRSVELYLHTYFVCTSSSTNAKRGEWLLQKLIHKVCDEDFREEVEKLIFLPITRCLRNSGICTLITFILVLDVVPFSSRRYPMSGMDVCMQNTYTRIVETCSIFISYKYAKIIRRCVLCSTSTLLN